MLSSLRWRLPLSYIGLALFATLASGAALIFMLRQYYQQQERAYLLRNAQAMSGLLTRTLRAGVPAPVLEGQVVGLAFMMQVQARVRDTAGRVLVDSGPPAARRVMTFANPPEGGDVMTFISHTNDIPPDEAQFAIFLGDAMPVPFTTSVAAGGAGAVINEAYVPASQGPFGDPLVAPSFYGFDVMTGAPLTAQRSDQVVEQPIFTETGQVVGLVELSAGPAYGAEIVDSVTRAWGVASFLAVVLAAGLGWVVSRRITTPLGELMTVTTRMAEGDLTARAAPTAQDEFGALGRSFNGMADRVSETIRTLQNFVADAAHELHTPITALRTNLDLVAAEGAASTHLAQAQAQTLRLQNTVNDLLDLSRLEAQPPAHTAVDLRQLLAALGEQYASRTEQAEVAFVLQLPAEPVVMQGAEPQLRRALSNVLDNAVKFTPTGGQVTLQLAVDSEEAVITVTDTGIGIPEDDLPHIFKRFHRGRNTAAYLGSGLGLALVKSIVEAHGGSVQVSNCAPGVRVALRMRLD